MDFWIKDYQGSVCWCTNDYYECTSWQRVSIYTTSVLCRDSALFLLLSSPGGRPPVGAEESGLQQSSLESMRPVDEVEVQVLQLQILQGLLQCRLHVLWVVSSVPQLWRDEHILSSQGLETHTHTPRVCLWHTGVEWINQTVTQTKSSRTFPGPSVSSKASPISSSFP